MPFTIKRFALFVIVAIACYVPAYWLLVFALGHTLAYIGFSVPLSLATSVIAFKFTVVTRGIRWD